MTSPPHLRPALRIVSAIDGAETLSDGSDVPPEKPGPAPAASARDDDPGSGVAPGDVRS